ncbi:MAG: response regulator transcription factor [Pseudomonadales bacterium]
MNNEFIFLVEDDVELAALTGEYLSGHGYRVEIEHDGSRAAERILVENPDLTILDVMLPGMDGLDVCRAVRERYKGPILILTARTDQLDQIVGLELGADDYVCKPVEPRLLAARVKALLRRNQSLSDDIEQSDRRTEFKEFDSLVIDNSSRSVKLDGIELELGTLEYDLLWLLAKNPGKVLSRAEVFEELRGIEYDGQNRFVDIAISQLRAKLGENQDKPARIKTIRSKGYLFVG